MTQRALPYQKENHNKTKTQTSPTILIAEIFVQGFKVFCILCQIGTKPVPSLSILSKMVLQVFTELQ